MGNEEIREKAFQDYRKGIKYKEIAKKYGVSESAVKSWAARYWKKEGYGSGKKKSQPEKKKVATRGAPKGNRNAVGNRGGAAPAKNKNAVKTGEFETLFFDALEPEEQLLIDTMPLDKEQLLIQEIKLLTVREHRMLKRIDNLKKAADAQEEEKAAGMTAVKYKSDTEKDSIEYTGVLGQIQAIEDALTRVQSRKQKAIDSLHRFGFDDARLEIELMKVELLTIKIDGQETEIADDGFMDALNAEAGGLWSEEGGE